MPRKKKEIAQDIQAERSSVIKAGRMLLIFADENLTQEICAVDKGTELRLDHLVWDKAFVWFGEISGWCDALSLSAD